MTMFDSSTEGDVLSSQIISTVYNQTGGGTAFLHAGHWTLQDHPNSATWLLGASKAQTMN